MGKWVIAVAALAALVTACGRDAEKKKSGDGTSGGGKKVVSGFDFAITIEPSTFVPAAVEPVKIASDGDAKTNPPGTVQLFTPNDTLTWQTFPDGDVFGFDVQLTNFYASELCGVLVVVDTITPAKGRRFTSDDQDTAYARGVTGAGVWAYGDMASQAMHGRRWEIKLQNKERFTLKGRVLADEAACGKQKDVP